MREMPELNPLSVPFDPPHHSAEVDWDHSADRWILDDSVYVSEPRSIRWKTSTTQRGCSICKHAGTTALNEGRIVSWHRQNHSNAYGGFCFRHQAPVGTADLQNLYYMNFNLYTNAVGFGKMVNGKKTGIASKPFGGGFTFPINTWRKVRITWWEEGGVLYLRVEWWNDTEWVQICDDFNDPDNLWSGSAVNRCGLFMGYEAAATHYNWWDDTEIWGP